MKSMTPLDAVEKFASYTLPTFKRSDYYPDLNFIFDSSINDLISEIPDHFKENFFIEKNNDPSLLTVDIPDSYSFFELLSEYYNSFYIMSDEVFLTHITGLFELISTKMFLRMVPKDFNNIYTFLNKQIEFTHSREFASYRLPKEIGVYEGVPINAQIVLNAYDESNQAFIYKLYKDNMHEHELAKIDYEVCYENGSKVVYINAVQNRRGRYIDKKIERSLYKLNKGIENSNVHPNQLLPLILFMDELRKSDIYIIKVPVINPLDYEYHALMGRYEKKEFDKRWKDKLNEKEFSPTTSFFYQYEKDYIDHTYLKEDYISYLKTEKLFNLMDRLSMHTDLTLINDLDNNDGNLIYRLQR